jgi:hypothetical protein
VSDATPVAAAYHGLRRCRGDRCRDDRERIIAAAIRSVRPQVRNNVVDLGTIRWTDSGTSRRVTFATAVVVRAALLALAGGVAPAPVRFILGRATGVMRPVRPWVPQAPG